MIDYQNYIFELNLNNLTQHSSGNFNATCNVCGDGDGHKHRLWFLNADDGGIIVKCFNGGCLLESSPTSFYNFLKLVEPALASKFNEEQRRDRFQDTISYGKQRTKAKKVKSFKIDKDNTKFFKKLSSKKYDKISEHPKAIEYCENRKIPKEVYSKFYYCVYDKSKFYNKMIMPLYRNSDNHIYGFVARDIVNKKFLVSLASDKNIRLYNIFNIDNTMNVYILESMIDLMSMGNDFNGIAMLTSSIPQHILDTIKKPIFSFDNDLTGINKSIEYTDKGYKVVIFPDDFKYKDINEAIVDGYDKDRIKKIMIANTYEGIQATLKLKMIKKKRRLR